MRLMSWNIEHMNSWWEGGNADPPVMCQSFGGNSFSPAKRFLAVWPKPKPLSILSSPAIHHSFRLLRLSILRISSLLPQNQGRHCYPTTSDTHYCRLLGKGGRNRLAHSLGDGPFKLEGGALIGIRLIWRGLEVLKN